MKVSPSHPFQLIYTLFEHPYLGYLFESFVIQLNESGNLTFSHQNISSKNAKEFASGLDDNDYELIKAMEQIVFSGTKLDLGYWIDEILDEDQQEEIHEYFLEAETDSIQEALDEFEGEYEDEEIRLYRLKFISEVAN